jgi:hypothetical protein
VVVPWFRTGRNDGFSVWVRDRLTGKWRFREEVQGNVWPNPIAGGGFRIAGRSSPTSGEVQTWRWKKGRFVLVKSEMIEPVVEDAQ